MSKIKASNPAKITNKNIKRFLQGWLRFLIYKIEKRNKYLAKVADDLGYLNKEQQEQFEWRLTVMNPVCLKNGSCIICGCETPQLQMAGEACEGNCYPPMLDKDQWELYKQENQIII